MSKERPNYLFRAIALVAPNYAMNIMRMRYMERVYAGAENYPSDDWQSATSSDANQEVQRGQKKLIDRSRDLSRNNSYAKKATSVIVTNTIGYGILARIMHKSPEKAKELQEQWNKLVNSKLVDTERRNNFATIQALAMRTIVESGEVLAIKRMTMEAPSIQLLEPEYIDDTQAAINDGWQNGIRVDSYNKRLEYKIYERHPGSNQPGAGLKSNSIQASKVMHVYDQTRPGQLRGVPWCHSVISTLKDFDDFQYATLIRQKISACLVGVITTNGNDNLLNKQKLEDKRKRETKMTPGSFRYADPGEDVKFNTPPQTQGYTDFVAETIRQVANGYGISYEALSGDYSKTNYSSGRMGKLEMNNNIDHWRWNMFVPFFCDDYMDMFKTWCKLTGLVKDPSEITHEWVAPAYSSIDPEKEINANKAAVDAGFKSRSAVIREQGQDPKLVREEIAEERKEDAKLGLNFNTEAKAASGGMNNPNETDNSEDQTGDSKKTDEKFYESEDGRMFKSVGGQLVEIKS